MSISCCCHWYYCDMEKMHPRSDARITKILCIIYSYSFFLSIFVFPSVFSFLFEILLLLQWYRMLFLYLIHSVFVLQFECQFQLSVIWCILAGIWFSLCLFVIFFCLLFSLSRYIYPCNTVYDKMLNHRQLACIVDDKIKLLRSETEEKRVRLKKKSTHER